MKIQIKNRFNGEIIFTTDAANITEALEKAVEAYANLAYANLAGANLAGADLAGANLARADLAGANLAGANLAGAYLARADLARANLARANLARANLAGANLARANLARANLADANLTHAYLAGANLADAKGLIKIVGVEVGNVYWKRFNENLTNNSFKFKVGLNTLRDGEVFANDERETCTYPGFHFASRSWCAINYPNRPFEAKIRIPEGAKINEPWTTDGKASADMIEILQVFDVTTGEDVTRKFL